jgi:glycerol-3-phosphate dehydrogenase (NAD(P)+)
LWRCRNKTAKCLSKLHKTKITDDIIGTEYAAMLKNIYAIAAGMAWIGYGDSFQSVLMVTDSLKSKFIEKCTK